MNVSRTPLREAIRQLEAEGFVTTVPRVGCSVSEITPQDVEDLYAIRTVIEGLAARQAAENPDPAKREVLENVLSDLAKRTADYRQYHELSGRFHDIIVELSGNRRLQGIYQSLAQHVSRMRTLSLAVRGRPEISLRGHRRIATAILRGEAVEAERAMRAHIEAAYGVLKQTVRRSAKGSAFGPTRAGGVPAKEGAMTAERAGVKSLTGYVAEFIASTRFGDIPADVVALGKKSILDGLGLALAGSVAKSGTLIRRHLQGLGTQRRKWHPCLGTGMRMPARFAAFANGTAVHADDYDDTQLAVAKDRVYGLLTHPTAPALPSTLAVAERDGRSGKDLLTAYHVGVEVECKIAEAIHPRHYQHGFHSTATCGTLGRGGRRGQPPGVHFGAGADVPGDRREPGGGLSRELRDHDEAVPRRPRGGRRRDRRRVRRSWASRPRPSSWRPGAGSSGRRAAATTRRPSWASWESPGRSPIPASPSSRTHPGR